MGNIREAISRILKAEDSRRPPKPLIEYHARAILAPGTDIEELQRQTEAYMKEHPEILLRNQHH